MRVPILTQLERQNEATRTLLPFVAALPRIDIDDETLVRVFGLTMAVRNFTASINYHWPFPDIPDIPIRRSQPPRTQEEKRACWRISQREYRKRQKDLKDGK